MMKYDGTNISGIWYIMVWYDATPGGGNNALLIWTICRKNHCKLSLVVEEYRSTVQYSMINCSSGILSTVVKVQYSMMNCSNSTLSSVVVSYEGYALLQ